jgi:two-component system NtrC family response regulator
MASVEAVGGFSSDPAVFTNPEPSQANMVQQATAAAPPSYAASLKPAKKSLQLGGEHTLVYRSPAMQRVLELAGKAAACDATVLICGETGVGKELMARHIHMNSRYAAGPFNPLNCAATPRELFESLLFGHRQGIFTGATRDEKGIIRGSAGGTLLLDEIGELNLEQQPKLLRFLESNEVHPIGMERPIRVDVRLIASTNRDLRAEVAASRFRADLYYRLNTICITVPPLRERVEDLGVLVEYFLARNAHAMRSDPIRLSPEALECLEQYDWPGNVRELKALLLRLGVMIGSGAMCKPADLAGELRSSDGQTNLARIPEAAHVAAATHDGATLAEAIECLERTKVREALTRTGGNFPKAARQLGLSTLGLRKKYRRLFTAGSA